VPGADRETFKEIMKEKPILFNGEMVRVILDGRKTQTRRVAKLRADLDPHNWRYHEELGEFVHTTTNQRMKSPYGKKGMKLWVRETWRGGNDTLESVFYRADDSLASTPIYQNINVKWKPSIHMPRWASRINLEITDIRVERLQDISEEDANKEGCLFHSGGSTGHSGFRFSMDHEFVYSTAKRAFQELWDSINGKPRADGIDISWQANPWVWVVCFKVVK